MSEKKPAPSSTQRTLHVRVPSTAPIKLPNPLDETQREIPKISSRDAPGG